MKRIFVLFCLIFVSFFSFAQSEVKNVIFLIGDGMGLAQTYAAYLRNGESLCFYEFPYTGLSITTCADRKVTDSGAGGTALAIGHKTTYQTIGLDEKGTPHLSLLKHAKQMGKSTAVICTSSITHATPASFIANVKNREQQEDIAKQYLEGYCDIAIGGGADYFKADKRKDKLDLPNELRKKGFDVVFSEKDLFESKSDRIVALLDDNHLQDAAKRGDVMEKSLRKTLDLMQKNENGFFIMLEGSKIDMEAHLNKYDSMIEEVLDFERCVKIAFEFAKENPNTLIVVTADHETGGLTLPAKDNDVKDKWTTLNHTGVPVPIFSFGMGAENFTGVMQNKDIAKRILNLMK